MNSQAKLFGSLIMTRKTNRYVKFLGKILLIFAFVFTLLGSHFLLFREATESESSRAPASYRLQTPEVKSRAETLMEEGKNLHRYEYYETANKKFSELLKKYPYTGYAQEASFLLAKGLFIEKNFRRSEQVIQRLKELDATSVWFGYSLLILARIYEERGERSKASQLYREVTLNFDDNDLNEEAFFFLEQMALSGNESF